MPDLLQIGSDWLAERLKACASQAVTYSRGLASFTVPVTIGRTVFEVATDLGIVERWESRDYLVLAADLASAGLDSGEPQRGDQIREVQNNTTYVYEVLAPGSEPAFRFSDPYRKMYRIHTKLVGTE